MSQVCRSMVRPNGAPLVSPDARRQRRSWTRSTNARSRPESYDPYHVVRHSSVNPPLGFSGGRNGGFFVSFRHQFQSPIVATCWDARRWLVADSLTSPTHHCSVSSLWCGLSQRSSPPTSCASRHEFKTTSNQLANCQLSGVGIEFEFPAAFVGGVVMP